MEHVEGQMDTPAAQPRTNVVRSMVRAETLHGVVFFLTIETFIIRLVW